MLQYNFLDLNISDELKFYFKSLFGNNLGGEANMITKLLYITQPST